MPEPTSIERAPYTVMPPTSEETEALGVVPIESTLGRRAVLLTEFGLGEAIARAAADENAVQRQSAKDTEGTYVRIFRAPSMDHTPQEREALGGWQDIMQKTSVDTLFLPTKELIGQELDFARTQIAAINVERYGADFDVMLNKLAPPMVKEWVVSWLNEDPPETSEDANGTWLRWLSREPIRLEDGSVDPNDVVNSQLLTFLQWHNHNIVELQKSPAFQESVLAEVDSFKQHIGQAEQDGWVAEGTTDRANNLLSDDGARHFVGDQFYSATLYAVAYAQQAAGQEATAYNPNTSSPEDMTGLIYNVTESAQHELAHLVGKLPGRWLNEAVTEHISLSLKGREVEQVSSGADGNAYAAERDLLASLIMVANDNFEQSGVSERISVSDFTRVYTTDADHHQDALITLIQKLKSAFGFNVLGGLASYMLTEEQRLAEAGVDDLERRQTAAVESARSAVHQQPHVLSEAIEYTAAA